MRREIAVRGLLGACLLSAWLGCSVESPPEAIETSLEVEKPARVESTPPAPVAAQAATPAAPAAAQADSQEGVLSREQLFTIGESRPSMGLDLERIAREGAVRPAELSDPSSSLRASARYRHQSDEVGPEGPRRPQVGVAEGGVAIPVGPDDSVKLRSGVRVDYEKDSAGVLSDAETSPTVGVEVRF